MRDRLLELDCSGPSQAPRLACYAAHVTAKLMVNVSDLGLAIYRVIAAMSSCQGKTFRPIELLLSTYSSRSSDAYLIRCAHSLIHETLKCQDET